MNLQMFTSSYGSRLFAACDQGSQKTWEGSDFATEAFQVLLEGELAIKRNAKVSGFWV